LIIENWNLIINKHDTVIVPGDLVMHRRCIPLIGELKGRKIVVGGNHDYRQHTKDMFKYVNDYVGAYEYKGYIVTHIPIHPMCISRYKGNIHGHLHSKLVTRDHRLLDQHVKDHKYFNVSLEQIDYKPIAFTALDERFNERLHGS
jgi:calcineurin-like phosphoesterase family protein